MKTKFARLAAVALVIAPMATTPALAGELSPEQAIGLGLKVFGTVAGIAERNAAEQRRREAVEREKARRAELRRSKAGRAQLAREEREAKRQAQVQTAVGLAVLGAILGGGGGGGSGGKTDYYYIEENKTRSTFCGKAPDGTSLYGC